MLTFIQDEDGEAKHHKDTESEPLPDPKPGGDNQAGDLSDDKRGQPQAERGDDLQADRGDNLQIDRRDDQPPDRGDDLQPDRADDLQLKATQPLPPHHREQTVTFQEPTKENQQPEAVGDAEKSAPQISDMCQNSRRMDLRLGKDFLEKKRKPSHSVIAPKLRHRTLMKNTQAIQGGTGDPQPLPSTEMLGFELQLASELVGADEDYGDVYIPQHIGELSADR